MWNARLPILRETVSVAGFAPVWPRARTYSWWIGAVLRASVLGRLDQRPTQARRALLGELSSPLVVAESLTTGSEPIGADHLTGAAEALRVADLREDRRGEDRPDAEDPLQRLQPLIALGRPA